MYYKEAKNFDCLIGRLEAVKAKAANDILTEVLGKDVVQKLSRQEREFLGVE
jgi:hypothetical protein